jgi:hypothetical protein
VPRSFGTLAKFSRRFSRRGPLLKLHRYGSTSFGMPPPWSEILIMTCCAVSQINTSIGGGSASFDLRCSMTACIEFRNNSPMIYSRWLRMYGKVTSRWPYTLISGIVTFGPYAPLISSCVVFPHSSTISLALHRRKISPTASWSCSSWALGKCHGELKVSVRARCCSAMTRRDIRCLC